MSQLHAQTQKAKVNNGHVVKEKPYKLGTENPKHLGYHNAQLN
jgi:hypothetical protein